MFIQEKVDDGRLWDDRWFWIRRDFHDPVVGTHHRRHCGVGEMVGRHFRCRGAERRWQHSTGRPQGALCAWRDRRTGVSEEKARLDSIASKSAGMKATALKQF